MNNIALIGAGNLGSRHLQALALLEDKFRIEVVDPNEYSISVARSRYLEVGRNEKNIRYMSTVDELSKDITIAIIATSSFPRKRVIEELISKKNVRYLILEKVVFQIPEYFVEVGALLSKRKIKTWINCPRRIFRFYKSLQKELEGSNSINMIADGGEWGFASSSIHMLDLYGFLTKSDSYKIIELTNFEMFDSKRDGYSEITGRLCLSCKKGNLIINSVRGSHKPLSIYITSDKKSCLIDEYRKKAWVTDIGNEVKEENFDLQYQSVLTNKIVHEIMETGSCSLTTFEESAQYHILLLNAFLKEINKTTREKGRIKACPIT